MYGQSEGNHPRPGSCAQGREKNTKMWETERERVMEIVGQTEGQPTYPSRAFLTDLPERKT